MRVLFDAHWWIDGPPSNKEVMKRVVLTWASVFPNDEIILAVRKVDLPLIDSQVPDEFELQVSYLPVQGLSAIFELPFLQRRAKADIVISHNFTPLFGNSAVFIQDFLFLSNPEWFTFSERIYFSLMRHTSGRARVVYSSSEAEGRRIRHYTKGNAQPVAVGLAANAELLRSVPQRPPQLGSVNGFLLSVGRLNVRKNLQTILQAAAEGKSISPEFPLVVVGERSGKGSSLYDSLEAEIGSGAIRFMGYTSDEELAWLYANADLFLFLSLGEGFGMPLIEASAFGTPMLVSDIPVFRELLGDSAAYVDPLNKQLVSKAIRELLEGPRSTSIGADSPASKYTWERCVTEMRKAIDC